MRRRLVALAFAGLVAGVPGGPRAAHADGPADPVAKVPPDLRPEVDGLVARGAAWLRRQAGPDGLFRWSVDGQRAFTHWDAAACDEGLTSLAVLALARAGVPRADPVVVAALDALRRRVVSPVPAPAGADTRTFTYAAGAFLWMLYEVRPAGFGDAAAQAALGLAHGVHDDGGWSYRLPRVRVEGGYARVLPDPVLGEPSDVSNAQFAVIGLLAAERLGVWRGDAPWTAMHAGLVAAARPDGAHGYRRDDAAGDVFRAGRRLTTAIAAANLFVALRRRGASRADALKDPAFRRALLWLDRHPYADAATGRWAARDVGDQTGRPPYYEMLAFERLVAFTGLERVGGADTFRVAVASLRALERAEGGWPGGTAEAAFRNAVEHTTLALLVLTRALDAVPVTSPDLTTGDLVGGKDALEPHFSDLVARAVRAPAGADGDARFAWQRAFVATGLRGLEAVVRLQADGPAELAPAAHGLLRLLTGFPVDAKAREARSLAWARFLFAHRATLVPSADGLGFVDR
ncbi:MAG: hypothetical protein U1E39_14345 [Planctomycetota bacterium]